MVTYCDFRPELLPVKGAVYAALISDIRQGLDGFLHMTLVYKTNIDNSPDVVVEGVPEKLVPY